MNTKNLAALFVVVIAVCFAGVVSAGGRGDYQHKEYKEYRPSGWVKFRDHVLFGPPPAVVYFAPPPVQYYTPPPQYSVPPVQISCWTETYNVREMITGIYLGQRLVRVCTDQFGNRWTQ